MFPSRILMNAAKKAAGPQKFTLPAELMPLFVAMSLGLCSATFFTYRKFAYDKGLRISENVDQSALSEVLEEADAEKKQ